MTCLMQIIDPIGRGESRSSGTRILDDSITIMATIEKVEEFSEGLESENGLYKRVVSF